MSISCNAINSADAIAQLTNKLKDNGWLYDDIITYIEECEIAEEYGYLYAECIDIEWTWPI
jgi:hypothetical protein